MYEMFSVSCNADSMSLIALSIALWSRLSLAHSSSTRWRRSSSRSWLRCGPHWRSLQRSADLLDLAVSSWWSWEGQDKKREGGNEREITEEEERAINPQKMDWDCPSWNVIALTHRWFLRVSFTRTGWCVASSLIRNQVFSSSAGSTR